MARPAFPNLPGMAPISIVIPTRDRPASLLATVQSILAGAVLPAQIVVGDQSVRERAVLPDGGAVEITHLKLDSVGLSRARNAAIAAARHDVLVFTDDDVLVEPDWLGRLVGALLAAPPRTVVTGRVLASQEEAGHVPSVTHRTEHAIFTGRVFGDPLFPNNMAARRGAFEEIGLFDERLGAGADFPAAEDNDWGYRLLEAGYRIEFVPESVLHHLGARRGRELARLEWAYGRGQGAFYAKHMTWSDRHMLRRLRRNAAYRLRRMPPALRGDRVALRQTIYLAGLISGTLAWWFRYGRSPRAAGADHTPRLP